MQPPTINFISTWFNGKEDRSWRCDLHPVMTKDLSMIVFNSLSDSGHRQVSILKIDKNQLNRVMGGMIKIREQSQERELK